MNITLSQPSLAAALADVGACIPSRTVLPILSHVLLETLGDQLQVSGSNRELALMSKVACRSDQDTALTLEYAKLAKIVGSLPKNAEVHLSLSGFRVLLRAGKSRFTLQSLNAEDYPLPVFEHDDQQILTLDGKVFSGLLRSVFFAAADSDVRYYLNGVLLALTPGTLTLTATDGHRLATISTALEHGLEEAAYIVPYKTVEALLKLGEGEVTLTLHRTQLMVDAGTKRAVSKLIDGKYPEYTRVIPTREAHPGAITVQRQALLRGLQRVAILSNETNKGVALSVAEGVLRLDATNGAQDEAQDVIDILAGEQPVCRIGVQYEYLIEALKATDAENIILHYGEPNVAIRVQPDITDPPTWIIMPMLL